jgi:hypothetical protein
MEVIMVNNYAIIKDGIVVNAAVAEADFAAKQGWVLLPERAGVGWSYVNGQFVDNRPPMPEYVEPTAPAAPTKEQLMAQLVALSAQIQALE